jgi:hypothetical protein
MLSKFADTGQYLDACRGAVNVPFRLRKQAGAAATTTKTRRVPAEEACGSASQRERFAHPNLDLRGRHPKNQSRTFRNASEYGMEDVILVLLALTATYLVVQIIVEAYTVIDHALMTRKQRRK